MRIDSHVVYSREHPPEHLQAILTRNKFDGAILLVDGPELPETPDSVRGIVMRGPAADAASLDRYQANPKFRGICAPLDSALLAELARRGIPLDAEMRPGDFPALLRLAERFPGLRIVIDHLARPPFHAGPSEEWLRGMEQAAAIPGIVCKLSGLLTEVELPWSAAPLRPFVDHALSVFGPRRLMFGSEWPVRLPDVTWKERLAAFTQAIGARLIDFREQVLGGTACDFYALRTP